MSHADTNRQSLTRSEMPSASPTKQAQRDKKQSDLHDACVKSLSAFGQDGATIEKLVLAIRECSDFDVASENSPNGEGTLRTLLQHGTEFEKVRLCSQHVFVCA